MNIQNVSNKRTIVAIAVIVLLILGIGIVVGLLFRSTTNTTAKQDEYDGMTISELRYTQAEYDTKLQNSKVKTQRQEKELNEELAYQDSIRIERQKIEAVIVSRINEPLEKKPENTGKVEPQTGTAQPAQSTGF